MYQNFRKMQIDLREKEIRLMISRFINQQPTQSNFFAMTQKNYHTGMGLQKDYSQIIVTENLGISIVGGDSSKNSDAIGPRGLRKRGHS